MFNPTKVMSVFDSANEEAGLVIFAAATPKQFNAVIRFKEDSSVTGTTAEILSYKNVPRKFDIEVTVSSCTASSNAPSESVAPTQSNIPSIVPSVSFSSSPSQSPTTKLICSIQQLLGVTYYFTYGGSCLQLELFENGIISEDNTDSTCSNSVFNPTRELSVFDSVDADANTAIFTASEPKQFNFLIRYRQYQSSNTATEMEIKIVSYTHAKRELVVEIKTPSC